MSFYDRKTPIPSEFVIDWDFWTRVEFTHFDNLIHIAIGIDPNKIDGREYSLEIKDRYTFLNDLVYPYFHDDSTQGYGDPTTRLDSFVECLRKLNIPYPEGLDKNIFLEQQPILTRGEKSSLTQKYNQLEKLFNEVVLSKYGKGVTAYQIAQDENIYTSEKTIKKYLKSK